MIGTAVDTLRVCARIDWVHPCRRRIRSGKANMMMSKEERRAGGSDHNTNPYAVCCNAMHHVNQLLICSRYVHGPESRVTKQILSDVAGDGFALPLSST
jgi:hypothetical protein